MKVLDASFHMIASCMEDAKRESGCLWLEKILGKDGLYPELMLNSAKWRQIYSKLDSLSDTELESWASLNLWNDADSKHDKIAQDLQQVNGANLLRILSCLAPCLHPVKLLQNYFTLLSSVLLNRNESLERINQSTKILTLALKTDEESLSDDIKAFAKKLFGCLVHESSLRWNAFEGITQGHQKTNTIALDPSRIPRLEYVLFSFGMAKPLVFYELLNDLANQADTRLQALMLLKTFLILEGAPTYYLIDSDLYKTVIICALFDTETSLFLTSVTILTIILPIVSTKAISLVDHLLSILVTALKWEMSFPDVIAKISDKNGMSINYILQLHSVNSTRFCINQFFTVMYGMFPCNVLEALRDTLKNQNLISISSEPSFIPVFDPYKDMRQDYQQRNRISLSKRIKELLSSHRCHMNTLCSSSSEERQTPWFMDKESSEIMITCFDLECSESFSVEKSETRAESIGNIGDHILSLNRQLYGDLYKKEPVEISLIDTNYEKDSVALLKIFYTILMNESFFKECMRQYHIFHIRLLKRKEISMKLAEAGEENMVLRLKSFEQEVKSIKDCNEELRQEINRLKSHFAVKTDVLNTKIQALEDELLKNESELSRINEYGNGWQKRSIDLERQLQITQKEKVDSEVLLKEQLRQLTICRKQNDDLCKIIPENDLVSAALIQELKAKNYAQNDAIQILTNQYCQLKFEFENNVSRWEALELDQPVIDELKELEEKIHRMSIAHAEVLQAQEQKFETVRKLLIYTQAKLFETQ